MSLTEVFFSQFPRETPEADDYIGEDGLLYCGKCHTKKEKRIQIPECFAQDKENKTKIVSCICKCKQEELEKREENERYQEQMRRIQVLKSRSFIDSRYKDVKLSSFVKTKENEKALDIAKMFISKFDYMKQKNQGILFYGPVGTGKSYTAACIANELLDRMHTVVMTSFTKILQDINSNTIDETRYINALNSPELLIIDDLGAERNTDYALEKVYEVIDGRYRSSKPLILTTNMSIKEMMNTQDIRYRRVYDRIFEMCYPVAITGRSWRESEAEKRFDSMKAFMEGENGS